MAETKQETTKTTPDVKQSTFIVSFETALNQKDADFCEKKLRVGKQIYNACLNEGLKRIGCYRRDPEYAKAIKQYRIVKTDETMPKEEKEAEKKRLGTIMNEAKKRHGFNGKYCLNDFRGEQARKFKGVIGSTVVTDLSLRAYAALQKYENGEAKKVHFVRADEDFSIEGTLENGLMFRHGLLYFDRNHFIDVDTSKVAKDPYLQEAMTHEIRHCRLTRKTIRGKHRYYLQILYAGIPPMGKRIYGTGDVTILDVKISHMEMETSSGKKTVELAPGCKINEEKVADIQRKMDSSRRATNPDNYNPDGTIKKGPRKWIYSKNYIKLRNQYREIMRKNAETRKVAHGTLTNEILSEGTNIQIKHLSYKELQKRKTKTEINEKTGLPKSKAMAGKAIAQRSPAAFVELLKRKGEYAGGEVTIVPQAR